MMEGGREERGKEGEGKKSSIKERGSGGGGGGTFFSLLFGDASFRSASLVLTGAKQRGDFSSSYGMKASRRRRRRRRRPLVVSLIKLEIGYHPVGARSRNTITRSNSNLAS